MREFATSFLKVFGACCLAASFMLASQAYADPGSGSATLEGVCKPAAVGGCKEITPFCSPTPGSCGPAQGGASCSC